MVFPGVVRRALKLVPTILQALALVVFLHVVGQGILSRFGSAKYRFSKSYQTSGLGFGSNKVQKVIKYIDKNIPRYSPKPKGLKLKKGKNITTRSTTSTTSTTPLPPPDITVLESEQKQRLKTLHSSCVKYGIGSNSQDTPKLLNQDVKEMEAFLVKQNLPNRPMWQNLICSKEHKLSFCPVYKAASTFILKKFLLIAPSQKWDKDSVKHLETQANTLARKEYGYLDSWDAYPEFTSNGTSIIFVRHPFERILSAFKDKLEDPSVKGGKFNEYYYNKYGRRIVMHYRKEKITGPSFKYPRFSEFIDYLLDKDLRYDDEHWAPFYKECTPCHVNYTFIGHFETLYWDMHLLANKLNLVDKWDDKTDYFQSSTYLKVSQEYFGGIDRDVIRKLYNRYKIDFELFGYSPEDYIKMGKPGPEDVIKETEPEIEIDKSLTNGAENKINDEIVKPEDIQISGINYSNEIKETANANSDLQALLTEENLLAPGINVGDKI